MAAKGYTRATRGMDGETDRPTVEHPPHKALVGKMTVRMSATALPRFVRLKTDGVSP